MRFRTSGPPHPNPMRFRSSGPPHPTRVQPIPLRPAGVQRGCSPQPGTRGGAAHNLGPVGMQPTTWDPRVEAPTLPAGGAPNPRRGAHSPYPAGVAPTRERGCPPTHGDAPWRTHTHTHTHACTHMHTHQPYRSWRKKPIAIATAIAIAKNVNGGCHCTACGLLLAWHCQGTGG